MTSVRKEHIRELKGPDQFQVSFMAAVNWAVKNARQLVYALVPVALVLVGLLGYRYIQAKRKDARLAELSKAELIYESESKKANDLQKPLFKKLQELEAKAASSGAKDAASLTPAQQAERDALRKQIEAIKPNHQASTAAFQAFYKANESNAEGWLAGMMTAKAMIDESKFDEALPILATIEAKAKTEPFYQILAGLANAGIAEQQGNFDNEIRVLDALDQLTKSGNADLKPQLQLMRGRALLLKGDKANAKSTLSNLIDTHASSPEAQKARSLLTLING